jgi:DNA polymerase delta subunit 4
MPPRRRAAAAPKAQPTLSFGNRSRVTKPSSTPTAINKAKNLDSPIEVASSSGTPEPQQVLADAHPSKPHVAELVVRQQAAAELKEPVSAEDERALKLSRKDLQTYWRKEEQKRKSPRGELNCTGGSFAVTLMSMEG